MRRDTLTATHCLSSYDIEERVRNQVLKVEEIRTLSQFAGLSNEWRDLEERCGARSLFLGHPWLLLCAKHLRPEQRLLILLLYRDGKLAGAAPLIEEKASIRHLPVRQIGFLSNPLSPFCDFLLEEPAAGLAAIISHLRARGGWDVLSFGRLREDSPFRVPFLSYLEQTHQPHTVSMVSRTPCLEIRGNWEEFWRSKSQKFRKTRRSVGNRIEKLGGVSVELVETADQADRALAELLALSRRSWTRREGQDLLAEEFERSFLTELTSIAAERGWVRIWLVRKDGDVIAGEYHLKEAGTEYGLRAHYDAAYAASSPGAYLDTRVVQHLFEEGCTRYDMGPGAVDYKLAWTDTMYRCSAVQLYHRSWYARFLERFEGRWIPALKNNALVRRMIHRPEETSNKAEQAAKDGAAE